MLKSLCSACFLPPHPLLASLGSPLHLPANVSRIIKARRGPAKYRLAALRYSHGFNERSGSYRLQLSYSLTVFECLISKFYNFECGHKSCYMSWWLPGAPSLPAR